MAARTAQLSKLQLACGYSLARFMLRPWLPADTTISAPASSVRATGGGGADGWWPGETVELGHEASHTAGAVMVHRFLSAVALTSPDWPVQGRLPTDNRPQSSPASCRGGLSSTPEVQEAEMMDAFCCTHLQGSSVQPATHVVSLGSNG